MSFLYLAIMVMPLQHKARPMCEARPAESKLARLRQAPGAPSCWRWRQERTLLRRWPACAVALAAGGRGLAAAGLAGQLWLWRLGGGQAEPALQLQVRLRSI